MLRLQGTHLCNSEVLLNMFGPAHADQRRRQAGRRSGELNGSLRAGCEAGQIRRELTGQILSESCLKNTGATHDGDSRLPRNFEYGDRFSVQHLVAGRKSLRHGEIERELHESEPVITSPDFCRDGFQAVNESACGLRNPSHVAAP